jgi:heptosyltransferase II
LNKKILIIQTAFIGDVILTLPLVQSLKSNFPESQIDFLCIPYTLGVLKGNPNINEVIVYDKHKKGTGRIQGLINIIRQIRQRRYDIAFLPHKSFRSALIAFLGRIPKRTGFAGSAMEWLYSDSVKISHNLHEVDKNLQLLEPFHIKPLGRFPEFFPKSNDFNRINEILNLIQNEKYKGIISIAPGSVWKTKRYPVDYYITIIRELIHKGYFIIIIGGEKDKQISRNIKQEISENIMDLCGELSILQSYLILKHCKLLVSNDSATVHLGSAAKIPVFDIYGPTIPEFGFYPLSKNSECIENKGLNCRPCSPHGPDECPLKSFECMLKITPSSILERIFIFLESEEK